MLTERSTAAGLLRLKQEPGTAFTEYAVHRVRGRPHWIQLIGRRSRNQAIGYPRRVDVYLETQGCRVNEAERSNWFRDLVSRGHRVVAGPNQAQAIVLNTCAVTGEAARKARRRLKQLRASEPQALLIATGCWSTLQPSTGAADLVLSNSEKDQLVNSLEALTPQRSTTQDPIAAAPRTRAFVKVQDGCRHRCTYCIVTIARGSEKSRHSKAIVQEINELIRAGTQEVVLTGIHLGGYGHDLGTNLAELVRIVLEETPIRRLRLSSLEPWDLTREFFDLWEDNRLCPHLHLPLQSGTDSVLRRMGRRTSVSHFQHLVDTARKAIPNLSITTDVIAGFPGESEQDATATFRFLEAIRPANIHVFTYSEREGTPASGFSGQLEDRVKRVRSLRLRELARKLHLEALRAAEGQVCKVLWERRPKPLDGLLQWRGHTETYLRVVTETGMRTRLGNRIASTKLTGVLDKRLELFGIADSPSAK